MRLTKRILGSVLTSIVVMGITAGCGSSESSTVAATTAATTAAETKAAATTAAETKADEGEASSEAVEDEVAESGGRLVIGTATKQTTFFMPQSAATGDRFGALPILESLGRMQEDGTYEPWLAEEFITDVENLTFTIKLRENVYFSDGSICDAEAVEWNIQQYIANGKASEIGSPKAVSIVDDLTILIEYDTWANNWDLVIGDVMICSKEAYEENGEEWCKTHAVGTGPFVLKEFIADNKITYVKNENYRIDGLPYLDELEVSIISDKNTIMSALINEEIGIGLSFQNVAMIEQLEAAGRVNIARQNANCATIMHVVWNSKNTDYPTGDLNVRKAIMHAIPWDDVATSLSSGLGVATPLFCSEDSWAYHPDAEFYEYDLDLAKQMLADAGYPDGFETNIYTTSGNNDIAVAFQAILSQIGITAAVEVMDSSALAAIQVADDIEGFIANRGSSQMDFTNNYIRLYSSEGIKNHGIMLRPDEFEIPLFAAREAMTLEEKKENLQAAAKALVQDYVMLTPLSIIYTDAYAVTGIVDTGIFGVLSTQWTPETARWE